MVNVHNIRLDDNQWKLMTKGLYLLRNNEKDKDLRSKIMKITNKIHLQKGKC